MKIIKKLGSGIQGRKLSGSMGRSSSTPAPFEGAGVQG